MGKRYNKAERKTVSTARAIWQEANARWFKGKLPRPRIYLADLSRRGDSGWYGYHHIDDTGKHVIVLDRKINLLDLTYTVVHEMIHQAQWEARSIRTKYEIHGRFFQRNHKRIFGVNYAI